MSCVHALLTVASDIAHILLSTLGLHVGTLNKRIFTLPKGIQSLFLKKNNKQHHQHGAAALTAHFPFVTIFITVGPTKKLRVEEASLLRNN